ncbi:hypothetical protein [Aquitalea sp. ASV11]|uniref:head-tail joining protein n=1 Tax=Aquitalea sp. ASV11 TaxID=2795103 RepID=UPI0018EA745F|nr:hypothetical protein [Aquitalea sp. ASV11]
MFRQLTARLDAAVFATLSDRAWLGSQLLPGMFSAPWLAPALGQLKTAIREPHYIVRDAEASRVGEGDILRVDGQGEYIILRLQPDGSGLTALILRGKGDPDCPDGQAALAARLP